MSMCEISMATPVHVEDIVEFLETIPNELKNLTNEIFHLDREIAHCNLTIDQRISNYFNYMSSSDSQTDTDRQSSIEFNIDSSIDKANKKVNLVKKFQLMLLNYTLKLSREIFRRKNVLDSESRFSSDYLIERLFASGDLSHHDMMEFKENVDGSDPLIEYIMKSKHFFKNNYDAQPEATPTPKVVQAEKDLNPNVPPLASTFSSTPRLGSIRETEDKVAPAFPNNSSLDDFITFSQPESSFSNENSPPAT